MTLEEKVDAIIRENGLKNQKELSELLNVNYTVFNRNVKDGRLTGDMIKAFAENIIIKCNLRWLVREDNLMLAEEIDNSYGLPAEAKFNKAIELLNQYKDEVSRK